MYAVKFTAINRERYHIASCETAHIRTVMLVPIFFFSFGHTLCRVLPSVLTHDFFTV